MEAHMNFPPLDQLAFYVSLAALIVSIFTLWLTYATPFSLQISAPAITQVDDGWPSLLIDFAFYNSGARIANVTSVRIRTFRDSEALSTVLYAQHYVDRFRKVQQMGNKSAAERLMATFVSTVVKGNEVVEVKYYAAPYLNGQKMNLQDVMSMDGLSIDFLVNGKWRNSVFNIKYLGFREKFKGAEFVIPEQGFAPTWYREIEPVVISGSVWGNS